MGSESSKSYHPITGQKLGIECYNAGFHKVQEQLHGYEFRKVACWARALEGKAGIEAGRVFASIVTLGLAEISRSTVGGTNHWAFVAQGTKQGYKDIYFVAQFGAGDISKFTEAQELQGQIVTKIEDAVLLMNSNMDDMNTWVVRGDNTSGWKYPFKDGSYTPARNLPWKSCSPKTIEKINSLIYQTACSGKPYSMNNNCQHFADEMFSKC